MKVVWDLALVRLGDGGGRRNCLAGEYWLNLHIYIFISHLPWTNQGTFYTIFALWRSSMTLHNLFCRTLTFISSLVLKQHLSEANMSSTFLLNLSLGASDHIKKARAGPTPSSKQGQPNIDRPMWMEKGDHGAFHHEYYNYKLKLKLKCWHIYD